MLTLRDVSAVPRTNWDQVTVEQVMAPWERLIAAHPNTDLMEAMQSMDEANVAQVPVVTGDEVVGMLSREHVLHYIRVRGELGI
jgi:CBS domain-containing protein